MRSQDRDRSNRLRAVIAAVSVFRLTHREMADATGLSPATVWRAVSGLVVPNEGTLRLLEDGLGPAVAAHRERAVAVMRGNGATEEEARELVERAVETALAPSGEPVEAGAEGIPVGSRG